MLWPPRAHERMPPPPPAAPAVESEEDGDEAPARPPPADLDDDDRPRAVHEHLRLLVPLARRLVSALGPRFGGPAFLDPEFFGPPPREKPRTPPPAEHGAAVLEVDMRLVAVAPGDPRRLALRPGAMHVRVAARARRAGRHHGRRAPLRMLGGEGPARPEGGHHRRTSRARHSTLLRHQLLNAAGQSANTSPVAR